MNDYSYYFDESQQLIRDSVQRFVKKEILPYVDDWEEQESFPRELYLKAGAAGILGIGYPEIYGGSYEHDIFVRIAAKEEMVRCGSGGVSAGLSSHNISLPLVIRLASDELKQRIAPEVISGEKVMALAITEPSGGSDVSNLKTRAVREGDYYRVTGSKTFITSGTTADYFVVAVRTGERGFAGISLLLMERTTPGFSVGKKLKKMGWRTSDTAELFFDNCLVPVGNLIGSENRGFIAAMENFQSERLTIAIIANATAQLALEESLRWANEREAFGKKIGEFQVLRHRLAEVATQIEVSREFTYRQAARMAAGEDVVREISMAKNFATNVVDKATQEAVQIFGGMGYMRESLVERLYRDSRILSIGGGTYEVMNEIICKHLDI